MSYGKLSLGRILLDSGVITQEQLENALDYQARQGGRVGEALVDLGICSDVDIARALAAQIGIPYVDLYETPPMPDAVALLPRELALEHGAIPIQIDGNRLLVAVKDPYDIRVDQAIRQTTSMNISIAVAPDYQLRDLLHQFYSVNSAAVTQQKPGEGDGVQILEDTPLSVEKLIAAGEQLSTIQIVNTILADAVRRHASDLHIRPDENGLRIRYRIDGRMCTIAALDKRMHQSVVARIKIMCGMDISESRKPQDGSGRVRINNQPIELRASTLPGVWGEVVVIRILTPYRMVTRLDDLGMETAMLHDLQRLLALKNGILMVSGPTGSGKTTTLYATLGYLNTDDVNIITVEDPVEVKLAGISQVQVDDRAGRSFAGTLRSMLRQDPDIIMVGEIRDGETAEIASRAALTGHLVLSTVHTRNALGTLERLVDLGIPPFMLAAALNGVIAQRLVRRVCDVCAEPYEPPAALSRALNEYFGELGKPDFRRGRGCSVCHHTGTHGRMGVYELLVVDDELRRLIAQQAPPAALRERVQQSGFQTMEQDALAKACRGAIPPEEVVELGLGFATSTDVVVERTSGSRGRPGRAIAALPAPESRPVETEERLAARAA